MMDDHLSSLRRYWCRHRAFPPLSGLASLFGLGSKSGALKAMGRLVEAGYLARAEGRRYAPTARFFSYPILGDVRAGVPQEHLQPVGDPEHLSLEDFLLEQPAHTAFCRVRGDSMGRAGLCEGDFVVMAAELPARPGDIVVAVVDDGVTVKYLREDGAGWFLEPANPAYPVLRPQGSLEVLGVVTGMFRKYRR